MPDSICLRNVLATTVLLSTVLLSTLLVGGCGQDSPAAGEVADRPVAEGAGEPAPLEPLADWKQERDASLRKEDGWLALVGLHWLEEGGNSFGSDPGNDLVMVASAPPEMGVLVRTGMKVELRAKPGVEILHEGETVISLELQSDLGGEPTVLTSGSLTLYLIERGERLGIRVKDGASPLLEGFEGMEYFEVDPAWELVALYEPYDTPREIEVPNILGTTSVEKSPGVLVIEVGGETHRLEPIGDPSKGLFLIFGDRTNGGETYGGGRFLEMPPPTAGPVIVDFNRAYNPPCVFSPYATCPLPPAQNKLPFDIRAGETMFGQSH